MQRSLIGRLSTIGFTVALLQACSSPPGILRSALDVNGDGLCDFHNGAPPPPLPDVPPLEAEPPYDLSLRISMAEGFTPPKHGRVALAALVPRPGSLDTDFEELFTAELPSVLPAQIAFRLNTLPASVLERVRGWAANTGPNGPRGVPARLSANVIIYDDANGNGHLDLGRIYGPQPPLGSNDGIVWQKFLTVKDNWVQKYGHVDFLGLSSPSDPENEILSIANVSVVYNDAKLRYELWSSHADCKQLERSGEICMDCSTRPIPFDPNGTSVVTSWSLDKIRP